MLRGKNEMLSPHLAPGTIIPVFQFFLGVLFIDVICYQ